MLKTLPELISSASQNVTRISAENALQEITNNEGLCIDVRETVETNEKPNPKALPIPRGVLEMKILSLCQDPNTPIYIHCATGGRATLAAEQLQRLGYTNVKAISCPIDTILSTQTA